MAKTILFLSTSGPETAGRCDAFAARCRELGFEPVVRRARDAAAFTASLRDEVPGADAALIDPGPPRDAEFFNVCRAELAALRAPPAALVEVHAMNFFTDVARQPALRSPLGAPGLVCGMAESGLDLALDAIARKLGVAGAAGAKRNPGGKPIFVLNGPNLNLLGRREPAVYGHDTLPAIAERCQRAGLDAGLTVDFRQSNHEGELVGWIQEALDAAAAVVINAAAYTHTSVAIQDALRAFDGPIIELHISNPHLREPFRHHSYVASVATGVIAGLGAVAYELFPEALAELLKGRWDAAAD